MKIAVIGAGMAGLVTLYTIKKRLAERFGSDLQVVAFERGDQAGGEWVFSDKPESYEQGVPMSSSVYKGLQTNVPYPLSTFHPDFPWPPNRRCYPTREEYLAYIQSFAVKFQLNELIKFSKLVTDIRRDGTKLLVDVKDLKSGETTTDKFDYVFFSGGQYRLPFIPPEMDTTKFTGTVTHYHDMKNPEKLFGKRVLVVGSSYGAMDMVMILSKHVESLYVSYNKSKPMFHTEEKKIYYELKPKLVKAIGNTAYFRDGSTADVDVILYATGFRQVHPLSGDLALDFNKSCALFPLYKHVVHPNCTNLFFVGKGYDYIIQLFRLHAEFACGVIDGRVALPDKETMLADIERFQAKWSPKLDEMGEIDVTKFGQNAVLELERELADYLAAATGCQSFSDYQHQLYYKTLEMMKTDTLNFKRYRLVDPATPDDLAAGRLFDLPEEK